MACFTKIQQRNGTNCEFEKICNFVVSNSIEKSHRNSVCPQYVCDKSQNARVCAKWQWNTLDWCYWIALPASSVVQSSNTVSCVSLSFRTPLCVLAIKPTAPKPALCLLQNQLCAVPKPAAPKPVLCLRSTCPTKTGFASALNLPFHFE